MATESRVAADQPYHGEKSPLLLSQDTISSVDERATKRRTSTAALLGQASATHTVVNLMKTCMGTGCLALSFACQQGGWLLFSVGTMAIAGWNVYAVQRLCSCLQYLPKSHEESDEEEQDLHDESATKAASRPPAGVSTMSCVAWYAFGRRGLLLVDIMMIILLLGIIISYVSATVSFISDTPMTLGPLMDAVVTASVMGGLSIVPDLGYLSHASAVGLVVLFLTLAVIAGYGLTNDNAADFAAIPLWPESSNGVSRFFGVAAFGYGVVPLTYNFRESMLKPSQMVEATSVALILVGLLYTVTGVGLLALYPGLTGDVLHELPTSGILPVITRLAMVAVVLMTAPLLIVPCGELLEGKWQTRRRALVRFGICGVSVLVAVFVPSFVQVLSFVGSACVGMVSFVLPPLLHWRLSSQSATCSWPSSSSQWIDILFLVWGISATLICSAKTLSKGDTTSE